MRRQQQANEIRTNIVFEFAVVGEGNVRRLHTDIMELVSHYIKDAYNIRVVGINLKKPTANIVYLMNDKVGIDGSSQSSGESRTILTESEFDEYYSKNGASDEETDETEDSELDDEESSEMEVNDND